MLYLITKQLTEHFFFRYKILIFLFLIAVFRFSDPINPTAVNFIDIEFVVSMVGSMLLLIGMIPIINLLGENKKANHVYYVKGHCPILF